MSIKTREDRIRELVASAPPLSQETLNRLRGLLPDPKAKGARR